MAETGGPALICFGNLTMDDVVLPTGEKRPGCIGGDALYAVLAARPWDLTAEMVAPVGRDLPQCVSDGIRDANLSVAGLPARDCPTLHNQVVYDDSGGRDWTLYNAPEDFDTLSPRSGDVPEAFLGADRVLISAMALSAQEDLVPFFKRQTTARVALDPQEDYIAGNVPRLAALISAVDIFLPSEDEVTKLTGCRDWSRAARQFAGMGPRIVVIKRGGAGALLYDAARDMEFHLPPCPGAPVVDTTGAGDSFCGAFMAALGTHPPEIAALAGAAAASFTVAGYGAAPLLETLPESVRARFAAWRDGMVYTPEGGRRMVLRERGA